MCINCICVFRKTIDFESLILASSIDDVSGARRFCSLFHFLLGALVAFGCSDTVGQMTGRTSGE